jgi:hypothetical protein
MLAYSCGHGHDRGGFAELLSEASELGPWDLGTHQVALTVVTNYANAADQKPPQAGAGYSAYTYAQTFWMLRRRS